MEALATRQLLRQQKEAANSAKLTATSPQLNARDASKERLELNRMLGFSDPPAQVFALGKEECAAVWWSEVEDEAIIGWEIHRFRKDKSRPEADHWHYKGCATFTNLLKNQAVINQLSNDYEYRFTVKAVSAKGPGAESTPSNPVMVEKPLPTGWYRFLDAASKRHYYANVRLGASSWARPEQDPWFLDDALLLHFDAREVEALKRLYKEEIAHFRCVSVDQFLDVLREVGERCSRGWVAQLFRGYAGSDKELRSWTHFMEVLCHIKKYRMGGGVVVALNPLQKLAACFRRKKVGALLQPKADKLGDWVVEYSSLAERNFYRNTKTGESCWSMPAQVKFYIPPRLEDKLLLVFDYGDLEQFQQYFSLLDVDGSGDLSGPEVRVLLRALDIKISEFKFQKLLKTVDLNGNGTIEFDEYCWMMLQIFKKDNSGFWTDIRAQHKALAATRPPIAEEQLDDSQGAADAALGLGLSEGSLENSLFGDRSWGGKLSYSRMRAALDTMAAFGQTPGKGGGRRFSLSSSGGSFRGSSFRAGSLFGRRGSLDSAGNADNSEGSGAAPVPLTTFRRFFCCLCGPRRGTRNHSSKLNQVLSSMDESAAATAVGPGTRAPSSSTTYYPPASFRAEDNNGNGGKISRPSVVDDVASSFSASGAAGSVAATIGTTAKERSAAYNAGSSDPDPHPPAAPLIMASPPRAGRRVSFSHGGAASAADASAGAGAGAGASGGAASESAGAGVAVGGATALDTGAHKIGRRPSNGKSKTSRRRRSAVEGDEQVPGEREENRESEDDRSGVSLPSGTSLLRRLTSFSLLGNQDEDGDSFGAGKAHPKHCMCGCRAY